MAAQTQRSTLPEVALSELAPTWDASRATRKGRAQDDVLVERLLAAGVLRPRRSTLDLGCGTGHLLELPGVDIDPRFYLGVDPSGGMLVQATSKRPFHKFARDDLTGLPRTRLTRQAFDQVVSLWGAWSFVTDPTEAVRAMAAVTLHQGRVCVVVPSTWEASKRETLTTPQGFTVRRRLFTAQELRDLFSLRFADVKVQGFVGPADHLPDWAPQAVHRWALRNEPRAFQLERFSHLMVTGIRAF